WCEKHAQGGSIAQRPQRSQRGDLRLGAKLLAGDTTVLVRETRARGKHHTEVTEEGFGLLGECATGNTVGLGEKQAFSAFRVLQSYSLSFVVR
ncbi:MAG TPA: hypothetical protein VK775_19785, partial [Chthoniobacterales bacterium]|nr:hypothetical protein [Chthoniobacterales bacterium]